MSLGKKEKISGVIALKRVAVGSKSERDAHVLTPDDGGMDIVIRITGEHPMMPSPGLKPLNGMRATIEGVLASGTSTIFVDSLADVVVKPVICFPPRPPKPKM